MRIACAALPLLLAAPVRAPAQEAPAQETPAQETMPPRPAPFGIRVVDAATGRGVPLVELETTGGLSFVTDSAGWIAFDEPGLLGERVWFGVRSHGYSASRDGFGFEGVALETQPGGRARVEVERVQAAERLYRLTGQGIYRDSVLLGESTPSPRPLLNGGVVGQDSVVTAVLEDRVLWFWGDTSLASYPLGLFEAAGAQSAAADALDPEVGIELAYFVGDDGFARAVCPVEGPGPVWLDGLCVVRGGGQEVLVAHYARMESLGAMHEHGLARWNPEAEAFEKWVELPLDEERHPSGHPFEVEDGGERFLVFPTPWPHRRVPATLAALGDPARYEAFTCLAEGAAWSVDSPIVRDPEGRVVWAWRRGAATVGEAREDALVAAGRLAESERLARLVDVETGARVRAHNGSVRWSPHRGQWVWLVNEVGGSSSYLGEVWIAFADTPLGPWRHARKVVTHDGYSFYNVAQHDFLARGSHVYFEGTYTRAFSRTEEPTPRYDYNQVLYRIDLDDPRLALPRAVYAWGQGGRGTLGDLRAAGARPADARVVAFADGDAESPAPAGVLAAGGGESPR